MSVLDGVKNTFKTIAAPAVILGSLGLAACTQPGQFSPEAEYACANNNTLRNGAIGAAGGAAGGAIIGNDLRSTGIGGLIGAAAGAGATELARRNCMEGFDRARSQQPAPAYNPNQQMPYQGPRPVQPRTYLAPQGDTGGPWCTSSIRPTYQAPAGTRCPQDGDFRAPVFRGQPGYSGPQGAPSFRGWGF
jgi:hypothetical protein